MGKLFKLKAMLALALASLFFVTAVEAKVRTYDLGFLSVDEAVILVKPLLENSDSVSGLRSTLYIDSSLATFRQIESVLKSADTAPPDYSVHIRQSGVRGLSKADSQENQSKRWSVKQKSAYQLQIISGEPVFVETGHDLSSLGLERSKLGARHPSITADVGKKGFYLLVRVRGDEVTLRSGDEQVSDRYNRVSGLDEQTLNYYSEGQLGHWIPLMGSQMSSSRKNKIDLRSTGAHYQVMVTREGD